MILFDFDGVLADSKTQCLAACKAAAAAQGVSIDPGEDAFSDLDPLTFEAFALRHELDPQAFANKVADHVRQAMSPAAPFPGVAQLVVRLSAEHALGIVSASHSEVIGRFLRAHRLYAHFASVVGGDMPGSKAAKLATLRAHSVDDADIFVGDAVSDIQAGRAVGAVTAAVTWGWQPEQRLRREGPDIMAHRPEDLFRKITRYLSTGPGGA